MFYEYKIMESQNVDIGDKLGEWVRNIKEKLEKNIYDVCRLFGWNIVDGRWVKMNSRSLDVVYAQDMFRFYKRGFWQIRMAYKKEDIINNLENSIFEAIDLLDKNSENVDLTKILCSCGGWVPGNFIQEYDEKKVKLFLDSIVENYKNKEWNLMQRRKAKYDLLNILIPDYNKIEFVLSIIKSELYNYLVTTFEGKKELNFENFQNFLKKKENWKYIRHFYWRYNDVHFAGMSLTLREILEKNFKWRFPSDFESLSNRLGIRSWRLDWYKMFDDETNWVIKYQRYLLLCEKIKQEFEKIKKIKSKNVKNKSKGGLLEVDGAGRINEWRIISLTDDDMKMIRLNIEQYILWDENKDISDEIKIDIWVINKAIEDVCSDMYIYDLCCLKFHKGEVK